MKINRKKLYRTVKQDMKLLESMKKYKISVEDMLYLLKTYVTMIEQEKRKVK